MRKVIRIAGKNLQTACADALGVKPATVSPINAKGEFIKRRELCAAKQRNRAECIALPVGNEHFKSAKRIVPVAKKVNKQHRVSRPF